MGFKSLVSASVITYVTFAPLPALSANVTVLVGHLPPMVFEDGTGREAEIIETVMTRCGHEVTFKILPFTRHWKAFEAGNGDAVSTVPLGSPMAGETSNVYIKYQNGVSALSSNASEFGSLSDLRGHSVIGFMGAREIIPGLEGEIPKFKNYKEVVDQVQQSRLLFGKRVDAVIGDGMIFAELNRSLREESRVSGLDSDQAVRFTTVFEPTPYTTKFRDPTLRDDFNRCFDEASSDGTISEINVRWTEKYRASLGSEYMGH